MFLHMLLLYSNPVYPFIIIATYFNSLIPNNSCDINNFAIFLLNTQ